MVSFWEMLSILVSVARHAQSTQNKNFALFLQFFQKNVGAEVDFFCLRINAEVFFKLIASLWVCVARHTESTENNKLVISMQYLKQNVNDEVDFLREDKHQRFLQIDTIMLGVCAQTYPNFWLLVTRVMWILYEVDHRVQWVMSIPLIENIEPVNILWQIL